jgi:hypothetical protein
VRNPHEGNDGGDGWSMPAATEKGDELAPFRPVSDGPDVGKRLEKVIATFGSMDDAQRALDALDWAGIETAEVSLHGRAADLRAQDDDQPSSRARDRRLAGYVVRRTLIGTILAAATCTLIGLIAGVITAVLTDGASDGVVIGVALAVSAAFGVIVGGLLGAESTLNVHPGWEASFAGRRDGAVSIAVQSEAERDVVRAETVLRAKRPISLHRLA